MNTAFRAFTLAVALIALTAGCRSMTGRSAGEIVDNKTTVAEVKTKLAADKLHNLTWVNVDANDGVVYLTGNARTAEEKARATEVAQRTKGVKHVVNNIVVNESSTTAGTKQPRASAPSNGRSTASTAPAASPATTSAARPGASSLTGEVTSVDQSSGDVTLRTTDGNSVQLRLPAASVQSVRIGDRLSVSVSTPSR
jgi:hyperosmotically inducible protein